jgi:hypothetical protein
MLVGAGYAVILAFAGEEFYTQYLYEISHREEVIASSGMYAGGDMILEIFVALLLMIPTFFLIWIVAKFEALHNLFKTSAGCWLHRARLFGRSLFRKPELAGEPRRILLS